MKPVASDRKNTAMEARPPLGNNLHVDVAYMNQRALQFHAAGKYEEAFNLAIKALKIHPANPDLNHLVAAILVSKQNFLQAHDYVHRALLVKESTHCYNTLGVCQQNLGLYQDAEASYRRAIMLNPLQMESTCNLADLHLQMHENEKVIEVLESRESTQENLRASLLFAEALLNLHRFEEAEKHARHCLKLQPDTVQPYAVLSRLEAAQGRVQKGIEYSRRLLESGSNSWQFFLLQGRIHLEITGDLDKAYQLLSRADSMTMQNAQIKEALGRTLLARGNYAEAWPKCIYTTTYLKVRANARQLDQHEWDGEAKDGSNRLLVYSGEDPMRAVQMLRFVPQAIERVERVAILCDESHVGLFSNMDNVRDVFCDSSESKFPTQNKVKLDDLPMTLKSQSVVASGPYLISKGGKVPKALGRKKKGNPVRVGIAWTPEYLDNFRRFSVIPLEHFEPLRGVMDTQLYSLQTGVASSEIQDWKGVIDLSKSLGDALSLARAIEELDVVICADTLVAHLAGAIGQEAWVVLPSGADWVWQSDERSEWYPTLRLFRQTTPGDWNTPMQSVMQALRQQL